MRDTFQNRCLSLFYHQKRVISRYLSLYFMVSLTVFCGISHSFPRIFTTPVLVLSYCLCYSQVNQTLFIGSLYVMLLYYIDFDRDIRMLTHYPLHRSTRVNRSVHHSEQISPPG